MSTLSLPLICHFDKDSARRRERRVEARTKERADEDSALYCAACGARVTHRNEAMRMSGAHRHRFTNPHGMSFGIGCFGAAPGCACTGAETAEHTWFAGYRWRIALCAACGDQLGWRFRSAGHGFFGLILDRLASGRGG